MISLLYQVSKYLIIILMAFYTLQCYTVFRKKDEASRQYLFLRQNMLMFFLHFVGYALIYIQVGEFEVILFYGAQVLYLLLTLILFRVIYPMASRLLINNMCMLLTIGFIMIARLDYDECEKQFVIAVAATVLALLIPVIIRKLRFITKMYYAYTLLGIGLLGLVAIAAQTTYGSKLSLSIGGFTFQPSEFVKIVYVFAIAGLLQHAKDFKRVAIATVLAAAHVLILVVSKDLGSAVIFFVTYLVMVFIATKNPFYTLAGILAGSVGGVGAYFLFSHVRTRVQAWLDPFADYQVKGYQVAQALFSITAGGWFGTGLYQGSPTAIPVVEQDMIFAAIAEELGGIFGICLILVCMSCFIMFVNIGMQLTNRYYRLVAVGLGTTYGVQVFLTIGGTIKLIPLTGVTLPLVSYGGSSVLSTLIMFAIVQGLYMLRNDEEAGREEKEAKQIAEEQRKRMAGQAGRMAGQASYYGPGMGYPGAYGPNGYSGQNAGAYGSNGYRGQNTGAYGPNGYPGQNTGAYGPNGYPGQNAGVYGPNDYPGPNAGAYGSNGYPGQGTGAYDSKGYRGQNAGVYGSNVYSGQNPGGYRSNEYRGQKIDAYDENGYFEQDSGLSGDSDILNERAQSGRGSDSGKQKRRFLRGRKSDNRKD
ncbi:MAG: FtsW/RodA/SpoVE family cell cycle protein [Clostridiales bacterium]|nr:FtsW/RodA/SpoVE family cell cycle protein [Clostridiales bacterium]